MRNQLKKKILAVVCFGMLAMSLTGCSFERSVKVEVNGEVIYEEGNMETSSGSSAAESAAESVAESAVESAAESVVESAQDSAA